MSLNDPKPQKLVKLLDEVLLEQGKPVAYMVMNNSFLSWIEGSIIKITLCLIQLTYYQGN